MTKAAACKTTYLLEKTPHITLFALLRQGWLLQLTDLCYRASSVCSIDINLKDQRPTEMWISAWHIHVGYGHPSGM